MGFLTDTYTLCNALSCTGAATPGVLTPGVTTFSGADFVRGQLRVKFAAITTAPTSLYVLLQSQDQAGAGATDWYPNPAAAQLAGFVTNLGSKDPNMPPIVGGQVILTAAPATADRYLVPFNGFPGSLFRVAVLAIGAAAAFTLTVQGEFQKWSPDNT